MEELDKSKFRFKIGDTVLYNEEPCKILAYYFSSGFNNFDCVYGYTLEMSCSSSHDGSVFSYNELGQKLSFKDRTCRYVSEKSVKEHHYSSSNDFSKAKPGDKVRVKPFDKEKSYQFGTSSDMILLEGKILTIESITKTNPNLSKDKPANYLIQLKEDKEGWNWSDAMLELLTEDKSCDVKESSIIKTIKKAKNIFKEDIDIEIIVKKKKPKLTFNL